MGKCNQAKKLSVAPHYSASQPPKPPSVWTHTVSCPPSKKNKYFPKREQRDDRPLVATHHLPYS